MVYKIGLYVVLSIAFIVGAIWLFNHINAWVGLGVGFLGVLYTSDKIYSFIKKNIKNEN